MRNNVVKKVLAATLACMMTFSMTTVAQAKGDKKSDKEITIGVTSFADTLEPTEQYFSWVVSRYAIGECLTKFDENGEIVPCLAEEWENSEDGKTWTFKIREGVKFSNGDDMTPDMVKASIERTAEKSDRVPEFFDLDSIEVDGQNLIFHLNRANANMAGCLADPLFLIVDTNVDDSTFAMEGPICTGPYAVESFSPTDSCVVVKNENYWDGAPEIKSITVKNIGSDTKVDAMLSGDIDLAQGPDATALNRVENNDDINIVKVTGTRENDFELNCREGNPLSDKNLRLALSYAVDRDVVAQVAGNGYSSPISTAFPPSVGYDSEDVNGQVYDLDKAKECLEAAGYSDSDGDGIVDKDGENLSLTISIANGSSTAVSETLQDMWKQIGVDVQIEMLENVSDKRASGDFDMLVSPNWQTVNAGDGQKYLMNRWSDGGSDNYSGYHSDEFQSVLDKLDAAFTQEDRVSAFVEAQQILADDAPAIWMYANDNVTLVNSKLENVTVFPIDYYLVTNKWTLAE